MSKECENLSNCGFMQKWSGSKNLACQGFISLYCKGDKQGQCARKAFKAAHNKPPSHDMMPNGAVIAAS